MGKWRGCWVPWPVLALGVLLFAVCEVIRHIHSEQGGILLQATDPGVDSPEGSSPLPASGIVPGTEKAKHAEIHIQMPCPGSLGIGVSTVSTVPWVWSRVLGLPQQTIGCWCGRVRKSWSLPVGLRSLWPTMGGGTSKGGTGRTAQIRLLGNNRRN